MTPNVTAARVRRTWSPAGTAGLVAALFGAILSGYVGYRFGLKQGVRQGHEQAKSILTIDEPVYGALKDGVPTVIGTRHTNLIQEVARVNYDAGLSDGEEAGWTQGLDCFEFHRCTFKSSPSVGRLMPRNRNEYWTMLMVAGQASYEVRKKLMGQLRERGLLGQN